MICNFDDGEYELTPVELAMLFAEQGWEYADEDLGYGYPGPEHIRNVLRWLVNEVMEDGRPSACERRGRFLAVRHDETGNSVDLYLNLGYVWATEEEDDEVPS